MDQPTVKVTDISHLVGNGVHLGKKVDLGEPSLNDRVNSILDTMKTTSDQAYVLRWEGNKVPRGAVVGSETLSWTQNGCAHNQTGEIVGTYERLVEFGGASGKEQVMVVYLHSKR